MRKHHSLPDSLELLLDTMCNTFGGIMFITISLLIISQVVSRNVDAMSEETRQKNVKEQKLHEIELLQTEIGNLQRQDSVTLSAADLLTQENRALYEQLQEKLAQADAVNAVKKRLEAAVAAEHTIQERVKTVTRGVDTETEARKQERENAVKTRLLQAEHLQAQIQALEERVEEAATRTIRFAKESETSLRPYVILLKKNKLHRYGVHGGKTISGEVRLYTVSWLQAGQLIPEKGHDVLTADTLTLDRLLKDVRAQNEFLFIMMDTESVPALVKIKDYLRANRMQCSFNVNPGYYVRFSGSASYRASF